MQKEDQKDQAKKGSNELEDKEVWQQYLRGCEFPCTRDDIERVAKGNGAPQDALANIRRLPAKKFESQQEFDRSLSPMTTS